MRPAGGSEARRARSVHREHKGAAWPRKAARDGFACSALASAPTLSRSAHGWPGGCEHLASISPRFGRQHEWAGSTHGSHLCSSACIRTHAVTTSRAHMAALRPPPSGDAHGRTPLRPSGGPRRPAEPQSSMRTGPSRAFPRPVRRVCLQYTSRHRAHVPPPNRPSAEPLLRRPAAPRRRRRHSIIQAAWLHPFHLRASVPCSACPVSAIRRAWPAGPVRRQSPVAPRLPSVTYRSEACDGAREE